MKKRYIITGAAGHLGSTILRSLKNEACEVYALILPSEQAVIEGGNIHYVHGDVCEPETLAPLFEAAEAEEVIVIHTAGIISISQAVSPLMRQVNLEGTRNMLQISKERHAARFVYVSSVHAIPEAENGQPIREVTRFSAEAVTGGYAKTKTEASQLVLDFAADGLPALLVHPSGIIGPYDSGRNHLVQLVRDFINGKLPVCVKGGYDFADVRDVAQGCLLAAEKGRIGQGYILSGQYLSVSHLLLRVGKLCGKKPPFVVPMSLARLAAPLIEKRAAKKGTRPLYTLYSLLALTSNSNFDNSRARVELGYSPRSIDDTIQDMTRWLMAGVGPTSHIA